MKVGGGGDRGGGMGEGGADESGSLLEAMSAMIHQARLVGDRALELRLCSSLPASHPDHVPAEAAFEPSSPSPERRARLAADPLVRKLSFSRKGGGRPKPEERLAGPRDVPRW